MAKNNLSPILSVPPEIFLAVAAFLTTGQLVLLAEATKLFRDVVFDARAVWADVDLAGMKRMSDEDVIILLDRLSPATRHCIHSFDLSDTGPNVTPNIFEPILRACPNLRTFHFRNRSDAPLARVSAELARLASLPNPPHLPHLTRFNLLEDRRLAHYIVRYDQGLLKNVQQAITILASPPPAPREPDPNLCDLHECQCTRHFAARTTPCADCSGMPRGQLCIVCQSFCDRCFRQYCTNCFGRHCELVHCLCPLTAFRNILCYCTECRPEFECPKCRHVYCHDHLVRCVFDRRVVSCRRDCAQEPGAQVTVCGVEECWNAFCADECEDRAKEAGWRRCHCCGEWVCGVCVPPGEAAGNTKGEGWTCYMCPEREYVVLFGEEDPWDETITKSLEITEAENEAELELELEAELISEPEPEAEGDLGQSFVFDETETSTGKQYAARREKRWHLEQFRLDFEAEEYPRFQPFYTSEPVMGEASGSAGVDLLGEAEYLMPWEELGLDRVWMAPVLELEDSDSNWRETEGKGGEGSSS